MPPFCLIYCSQLTASVSQLLNSKCVKAFSSFTKKQNILSCLPGKTSRASRVLAGVHLLECGSTLYVGLTGYFGR